MLQLVVDTGKAYGATLWVMSLLEPPNLNDKLKHVGQLASVLQRIRLTLTLNTITFLPSPCSPHCRPKHERKSVREVVWNGNDTFSHPDSFVGGRDTIMATQQKLGIPANRGIGLILIIVLILVLMGKV